MLLISPLNSFRFAETVLCLWSQLEMCAEVSTDLMFNVLCRKEKGQHVLYLQLVHIQVLPKENEEMEVPSRIEE